MGVETVELRLRQGFVGALETEREDPHHGDAHVGEALQQPHELRLADHEGLAGRRGLHGRDRGRSQRIAMSPMKSLRTPR